MAFHTVNDTAMNFGKRHHASRFVVTHPIYEAPVGPKNLLLLSVSFGNAPRLRAYWPCSTTLEITH